MVEGGGFEPPKAEPTDLQSAPFDRSGTPPSKIFTQTINYGPRHEMCQLVTSQFKSHRNRTYPTISDPIHTNQSLRMEPAEGLEPTTC